MTQHGGEKEEEEIFSESSDDTKGLWSIEQSNGSRIRRCRK